MALPTWFVVFLAGYTLVVILAAIRRIAPGEFDPSAGRLDWPELGVRGDVGGACPVYGRGTIKANTFEFFAQNDSWTFDVTEGHCDPRDLPAVGNCCHFEGEAAGSSYLTFQEAEGIIRDCVLRFLRHDRPLPP